MDLKGLIKQGESEIIEFKESLQLKNEIGETVSAFSNSRGGIVLIGIADTERIIGVEIGKNTMEEIANYIKRNTDPQVFPSIGIEKIKEKRIIVIEVQEGKEKPVFFGDRVYKRVGKTNQRISSSEIRKLALEGRKVYWDELICEEASLRDIDEKKVRLFLRKAEFERRLEIDTTISVKEVLKRLNLIKDNKITNASILLFGQNPQRVFLQAEVRCARFKGTEPLEFIDMKVFGGNIIAQREDSLEFVKEHIKLHAEIQGTERVERWEYPIEAIREAITNAICHRDYEISSNVQVRIFDDRIEVWGCGPLPVPLTVEDLKRKHDSVLRNPLIGKCFFLIKYIEQWGTGTNRIIKGCLNHGLPEPLFEEIAGNLVVTFRKYRVTEEILKEISEEEKIIINYLKEHEKVSTKEGVELLKISRTTMFRQLKSLEKKGIIKKKGKGRSTFYILV